MMDVIHTDEFITILAAEDATLDNTDIIAGTLFGIAGRTAVQFADLMRLRKDRVAFILGCRRAVDEMFDAMLCEVAQDTV